MLGLLLAGLLICTVSVIPMCPFIASCIYFLTCVLYEKLRTAVKRGKKKKHHTEKSGKTYANHGKNVCAKMQCNCIRVGPLRDVE